MSAPKQDTKIGNADRRQGEGGDPSSIRLGPAVPAFMIAQRGFEWRSRHGIEQPFSACASLDLDRAEAGAVLDDACLRSDRTLQPKSIKHAFGSVALSRALACATERIAERVFVTVEDKRAALARMAAEDVFVPILAPAEGRTSPDVALLERALLKSFVVSEVEVTALSFIVDYMAHCGLVGYPPHRFEDRPGVREAFAPVRAFLDEHLTAIVESRYSVPPAVTEVPADCRLAWRMLRDGLAAHGRRWSSSSPRRTMILARPEPMSVLSVSPDHRRENGTRHPPDTAHYKRYGENPGDPPATGFAGADDARADLAGLLALSALVGSRTGSPLVGEKHSNERSGIAILAGGSQRNEK